MESQKLSSSTQDELNVQANSGVLRLSIVFCNKKSTDLYYRTHGQKSYISLILSILRDLKTKLMRSVSGFNSFKHELIKHECYDLNAHTNCRPGISNASLWNEFYCFSLHDVILNSVNHL